MKNCVSNFTRTQPIIKAISHFLNKSFQSVRLLLVIISSISLFSCSSTPEVISPDKYEHVSQIQSFEAKGKVAIFTPDKRESVNFHWQQDKNKYQIRFTTFLGLEVAYLEGDHQNLTIKADGREFKSTEPEVLLKEVVGWQIPLKHLSHWLIGNPRGVVMSKHEGSELAKKVLARISSQQEWMITYDHYLPIHKLHLPDKINLKQYQYKINMSINQWIIK